MARGGDLGMRRLACGSLRVDAHIRGTARGHAGGGGRGPARFGGADEAGQVLGRCLPDLRRADAFALSAATNSLAWFCAMSLLREGQIVCGGLHEAVLLANFDGMATSVHLTNDRPAGRFPHGLFPSHTRRGADFSAGHEDDARVACASPLGRETSSPARTAHATPGIVRAEIAKRFTSQQRGEVFTYLSGVSARR